jgi:hypothetical protein
MTNEGWAPDVQCGMRDAIILFAAFTFTSVTAGPIAEVNAALQQIPTSGQTLRLAAACESIGASADRVAAATLGDIVPCTQPHHVATA